MLLTWPADIRPGRKRLVRDKRSSLFCQSFGDEEQHFIRLRQVVNVIICFSSSLNKLVCLSMTNLYGLVRVSSEPTLLEHLEGLLSRISNTVKIALS